MAHPPEHREHDHKHAEDSFMDAGKRGAHEMDKVTRDIKKGLKKFDKEAEEGAEVIDDMLDRED